MPLIKSGSKAAVSTNIREMMEAGHPQKQAVAAALSNARKYGAKMQFGGAAGMPFGVGMAGGAMPTGAGMPMVGAGAAPAPQMPAPMPTPAAAPAMASPVLRGSPAAMPAQPMPQPAMGGGGGQQAWWQNPAILSFLSRLRGGMGGGYGGMKRGGVPRMQAGGLPIMPWFGRQEARNLTHGFLKSNVPGRTDRLPLSTTGGSYVVPADHLAYLGQGNGQAGWQKMAQRFGLTPSGQQPMKSGRAFHMPSLPRPPRMPKMATGGHGKPVDIVAAGGEGIIPAAAIIQKFGSLEKGHRQLDKEIIEGRKKNIKQLKNLAPPKK